MASLAVLSIAVFVLAGVVVDAAIAYQEKGVKPENFLNQFHHHRHGEECDGMTINFTYSPIADVARTVYKTVQRSNNQFTKMHGDQLLESPTAQAIAELKGKVNYIKNFGGEEECLSNGEGKADKDFRKRHATVVFDCEAGWQQDTELETKVQHTLRTLIVLEKKAAEALNGCKPGNYCYTKFKTSALGMSIAKQLSEVSLGDMVDIQVKGDSAHLRALQTVSKCNADGTDSLRKDIYSAIAKMNVCAAHVGLLPTF